VPILKKYGATAIFFPITGTFEGVLPSTHKIHILLSRFSPDELIDSCNIFFETHYPKQKDQYKIPKDVRITTKRKLRDDIKTANFKETMNILPNNVETRCLGWLFEKLEIDEKKRAQELFMSQGEIQDLEKSGFTIGSHTHNHFALDAQTEKSIQNEIRLSKEYLGRIVDRPLTIMSYPHSGFSDTVITAIKNEGFTHAVTIERRALQADDNPYLLPRYDVNDIVV